MAQNIIYSPEGELKVLLDCFPFFLHFLISLIKIIFWNLGKAKEAKVFLQTTDR